MASYIKCLRAFIAPFFVAYTVLVTYFLAQRAWDDVSNRLRRQSDHGFLDVLVQEERRHLHRFQDVVKNYRGDAPNKIGDNVDDHKEENFDTDYKYSNRHVGLPSDTNTAPPELDWKVPGSDFYRQDNESRIHDGNDLPDDLKLEEQDKREPRPVFRVEVEEWDDPIMHTKAPTKTSNSMESSTHSNYKIGYVNNNFRNFHVIPKNFNISTANNQNIMQHQKSGYSRNDSTYTTEFCENLFDVFGLKPTICKRELAETGSRSHVDISTYSLLFRRLGDVFIFSAFLDTREKPRVIRLIVLGPRARGSNKSVLWCVFYLRFHISSTSNPMTNSSVNGGVVDKQNPNRQGTQLTYYPASDGHNKSNQFYIMTCPVPEVAMSSILPPYRGLFQIVVGDLQNPFLGAGQESVTVKVIRNGAEKNIPPALTKPSHFNKMEQDLLTLNVPGSTVNKNSSIPVITGNNNKRNDDNSDSDMRNSKLKQVVSNTDTMVEMDNVYIANFSDDKIVTCVAPLQGNIGVIQLAEFIELSLLLGSQHIVFYTFQISEENKKVLTMYEGRGLVTVLPWTLRDPESVWARGRDMALNDCLYRTMHIYDYALFLDMDEFLVPRVTPDIPSFLKYLKVVHRFNSTRFSDLVFSSAYFPPLTRGQHKNLTTMPDFTRDVNKLVSLRNVYRTYVNPKHTLRLIRLSKAFRVGAGERKRTSFTISPRFASVNHYSYCPSKTGGTNNLSIKQGIREKEIPDICNHTKQDLTMWRYKSALIQRVKDSVRRLNGGL